VSGIKALYESELADARRVLDETARERARLQIEMGKLRAELDEVNKSAKKREGELTVAQSRVKDLESLFHRSEAELAAALSDKRGLESEASELRAQLAKAEDGHVVAKQQLEKETLMRVDLENRCQSLQEELDFRRSVFEEEVRETRRRHERRLVEVDSSRQQEHDAKMAQALAELRDQHAEQVRLYRQELEQTYQDQSLGNWRIKRQILEGTELAYKFTPKYVLRAGQTVTVWAAGAGVAHSPPATLVWKSQSSWGTGESFRTVLVNADGEEVAVRTVKQSSGAREIEDGEEDEEEAEFQEENVFLQQGDPRTTSRGCRVM
ncbi:lamin-B2-like, partial [Carlito syrichta]|uniref:Lamin-B2-like n=1 Tax=Carlito syrichta TaxID=1868482 RepID=A0A3Q0DDD9_CARSF